MGNWVSNTHFHVHIQNMNQLWKTNVQTVISEKYNSIFMSLLHAASAVSSSLFAIESGLWLHGNGNVKEKKMNDFAIFSSSKKPVWAASNQLPWELRWGVISSTMKAILENPVPVFQAVMAGGSIFRLWTGLCKWLRTGRGSPQLRVLGS